MPDITLVYGRGSEHLAEMHAYLSKCVPQALSTPFHRLEEGDINVGVLNNQSTRGVYDIEVRIVAVWDIFRWLTRKKRATMIRDYFETYLMKLDFTKKDSDPPVKLKVSVSLSLSLSAYVGTGYDEFGDHVAMRYDIEDADNDTTIYWPFWPDGSRGEAENASGV